MAIISAPSAAARNITDSQPQGVETPAIGTIRPTSPRADLFLAVKDGVATESLQSMSNSRKFADAARAEYLTLKKQGHPLFDQCGKSPQGISQGTLTASAA